MRYTTHDNMRLFDKWLAEGAPRKFYKGERFSEYKERADYWRECSGYWLGKYEPLDVDGAEGAS